VSIGQTLVSEYLQVNILMSRVTRIFPPIFNIMTVGESFYEDCANVI